MKYPFVHTNNHDYSFFFHRKETLVVHLSGGRQALMWRRKIQFISTSLCLIAKSLPHVVKLLFDWDGYKCGVHLVCSGLAAPSRVSSLWTENITSCLLENCFREQNRMGGGRGYVISIYTVCQRRQATHFSRGAFYSQWRPKQTSSFVARLIATFDDIFDCCAFRVHHF